MVKEDKEKLKVSIDDEMVDSNKIIGNFANGNHLSTKNKCQINGSTLKQAPTNFFRALTVACKIEYSDEEWEYTEEPHISRRREILAKHPDIKKLMGHDPMIALVVFVEVVIQMTIAILMQSYKPNWLIFLFVTYVVGASLNHSLGSAIHEIGHNLAFGHCWPKSNRILSLIANLPMVIPIAISYKKYHHEHHRWLGHEDNDVDIPMRIEVKLFQSPPLRILWLFLHPLIHGVRPFFKSPKPLTSWEICNFVTQIIFNIIVIKYLGYYAIAYLVIGTVIGLGPHPLAGHFISEHYLFADNQATHSYYGPLNPLLFNVGYHVEHHDFPYIPHTKLHLVKAMAPEYYDNLPYHSSLIKVVWDFIWDPKLGPKARSIVYDNKVRPELFKGMKTTVKLN